MEDHDDASIALPAPSDEIELSESDESDGSEKPEAISDDSSKLDGEIPVAVRMSSGRVRRRKSKAKSKSRGRGGDGDGDDDDDDNVATSGGKRKSKRAAPRDLILKYLHPFVSNVGDRPALLHEGIRTCGRCHEIAKPLEESSPDAGEEPRRSGARAGTDQNAAGSSSDLSFPEDCGSRIPMKPVVFPASVGKLLQPPSCEERIRKNAQRYIREALDGALPVPALVSMDMPSMSGRNPSSADRNCERPGSKGIGEQPDEAMPTDQASGPARLGGLSEAQSDKGLKKRAASRRPSHARAKAEQGKSDEARRPHPPCIPSDMSLGEWVTCSSLISTWNAEIIRGAHKAPPAASPDGSEASPRRPLSQIFQRDHQLVPKPLEVVENLNPADEKKPKVPQENKDPKKRKLSVSKSPNTSTAKQTTLKSFLSKALPV